MALVDHAERLDRTLAPVLRVRLRRVQPIDVETGYIDIGPARHDPVGEHAPEPTSAQHADGIQKNGLPVPLALEDGHLPPRQSDRKDLAGHGKHAVAGTPPLVGIEGRMGTVFEDRPLVVVV